MLADPKIAEHEALAAMLDVEPQLTISRPGLILIIDKGFAGRVTKLTWPPAGRPAAACP